MSTWFGNNMDIVFFIYGLAFFVMGVGIFVQARGETKFKLANILWILGLFGLSHGANEWMDGFALGRGHGVFLDIVRVFLLSFSYLLLFEFGRQLFRLERDKHPPLLKSIADGLVWGISPVIIVTISVLSVLSRDFLGASMSLSRYFLGFPGGILSSLGLLLYYHNQRYLLAGLGVRRYFFGAAIAFFVYGLLGGLVTPKGHYVLSLWLNTESFINTTHIPVQVFRAVCAIAAGWSMIGILKIFHLETMNKLKEEVVRRKQMEIERAELNAELMDANKKLTELAILDPHTGLYNYRYLVTIIEAEFERAKRTGQPLSLTIMDIDYFKPINDVYGHPFGNLVLQQLALLLKRAARRYDTVVRYGGEEFIIVSPGMSMEASLNLCQRLMDAIGTADFGDEAHPVKLKVSMAVASYPNNFVMKGLDLVGIADKILSKVKEDGGNRFYSSKDTKLDHPLLLETSQEVVDVQLLKEKIRKLSNRANQSLIEAIVEFAKAAELKDHYSQENIEWGVIYSVKIARSLGLSEENVEAIRLAAILHDLGKIGISQDILGKPSRLNESEMEKIKTHPMIGIDIVGSIPSLEGAIPLILHHHERWDGTGYPSGLKGAQIPLGARIIAVTDVYQALTSQRPYNKAYSKQEALNIIIEGVDKQFDPKVVDAFS